MIKKCKRIIAVGDLHGRSDLLKEMVEESIGFNPAHDILIFLGDYIDYRPFGINGFDRGAINSAKVVGYLSELRDNFPKQIILLKGNHEALVEKYFNCKRAFDLAIWEMNGGIETIGSFSGLDNAETVLVPFIKSLQLYYQTPYADFVHANVPRGKTLETATEEELLTDRGDYHGERVLVSGHTIHKDVVRTDNKITIDTGAFFTGKLTALDIKTGEIYIATEAAGECIDFDLQKNGECIE